MKNKQKNLKWIITKSDSKNFPYKLYIQQDNFTILSLLLQDRWPGEKGNIFCLINKEDTFTNNEEIVEQIDIVSFKKFGSKINIVLNRNIKKRCEFLFIEKKYKTKDGTYTQIFFRTQKGITERKLKNIYIPKPTKNDLIIGISTNERYPYKFNKFHVRYKYLPLGDYILEDIDGNILAVVERKTFNNFCRELSNFNVFIMRLLELQSFNNSALVVESTYSDFFNSKKLKPYLSVSLVVKLLHQIFVKLPKLPIVFAGNRKMAEQWVTQYFLAVSSLKNETKHKIVKEIPIEYYSRNFLEPTAKIIKLLKQEPHSIREISEKLQINLEATRKYVYSLAKIGVIHTITRGKNAKWKITSD